MMNIPVELQRSNWRRVKANLGIDNPISKEFSSGGLVRHVTEPSVRLLILPSDQESVFFDFNNEFWKWWSEERNEPFGGKTIRWSGQLPTVDAAVLYMGTAREMSSYLALHRNGSLEHELGNKGAVIGWNKCRYFRLTHTVARIWSALAIYQEIISRFKLIGPWEVSCALCNTKNTYLANFGEGWAEPGESNSYENYACNELNLLLSREIREWPDESGTKDLAFSFGGWIEDAWGHKERRFLARSGYVDGQFDATAFRRTY